MNDWRALGYVPDSEGEDDSDILLSPPRATETEPAAATQLTGDISNERAKDEGRKDVQDVFDFPTSSIENEGTSEVLRRGRGRPPKRGRGAKRLSVRGSQRVEEHIAGEIDTTSAPGTPIGRDGNGLREPSSSRISPSDRLLLNLDSTRDDVDVTLDTNPGATSPSWTEMSAVDTLISSRQNIHKRPGRLEVEQVDLIDEHGPDSEPEDALVQPPSALSIPPSSPPVPSRIFPTESIVNTPALPSRTRLVGSDINSPAPPTPVSISSNLEVRIPVSSHTGLTDPATRIDLDSTAANSDEPLILPDDFTSGIARNLRTRKPIQLNPYQLEQQRYNNDWKSRGLKPIKYILHDHILPSKKMTEKDSQEDEWVAPEGEDEETQIAALRHTQSFNSLDQDSMDLDQRDSNGDEGLPDLDELFRRSAKERPSSPGVRKTADGSKRRKTYHPSGLSAKSRKIIEAAKATLARGKNLDAVPEETSLAQKSNGSAASSLPKTPVPRNKKSHGKFDIFDLGSSDPDSDLDPLADKPPPSTSRRQVIFDSDESNGGETTPRAGSPTRRRMSVSPSSASEDDEESQKDPELREHEIHMYQRRIRGVLPASWLRLNQTRAQENKKPATVHHSPEARPVVKGMAQMRIRARNSSPPGSMANPVSLSSDDGSDSDDRALQQSLQPASTIQSSRLPDLAPVPKTYSERSHAFEDHGFDRMLSRSRGPTSGTNGKKKASRSHSLRQSKLSKGSFSASGTGGHRNQFGSSKPRRKPIALSVVDACKTYRKTKSANPPQFMRVAERLAKKRKNMGRHIPDRKIVQIDNFFEDETDGEDTLARWKRTTGDVPSLDSFRHAEEPALSSATFRQAQPGLSKRPSINERQPIYLQTKLTSQRVEQESTGQHSEKPRLKSRVTSKPIALLPQPVHRRMGRIEDVLDYLRSNTTTEDLIEDSPPTPQLRAATTMPPKARASNAYQSLPIPNHGQTKDLYWVNAHSKGFKNGKVISKEKQNRGTKKASAPRRIERHRSPIAYQPPERQLIELPESMEIDATDGKTLSFENVRFGTTYSRDFDIKVSETERTLFHESTFIGNGCLARALQTGTGKSYRSSGNRGPNVDVFGRLLEWSVYEEVVAEQFESGLSSALGMLEQILDGENVTHSEHVAAVLEMRKFFRYVIDYLSTWIFFSDLIDIGAFAARFLDILYDCVSKIGSLGVVSGQEISTVFRMQMLAYAAVLTYQVSRISEESITPSDQTKLQYLRSDISETLISLLMAYGSQKLHQGLSTNIQKIFVADKLNEQTICLECWIIAFHTTLPAESDAPPRKPSFWECINASIGLGKVKTLKDINVLDAFWRDIFRLLPLSTIDAKGRMSPFEGDGPTPDNWELVKELMGQSLTIYNSSVLRHRITTGPYIKILFIRCLILLRDWKWGRPDQIIPTLYDRFAKKLQNLVCEKETQDPKFLAHLDSPSFSSSQYEMCFSIFLKIVALGTKKMESQGAKGLSDLVVRLIPNHGRVFLKEENSERADVDTLANHHYLLTALYYGVDRKLRKRIIGIVKRLVDPEKSHAEVCALSLRTWANILICELASDEKQQDLLDELMKWHASFVRTTAKMHRDNDRLEQERKKKLLEHGGDVAELEFQARKNKRELESVLSSAISLLQSVFKKDVCDFHSAETVLGPESLKIIYEMANNLPHNLVSVAVGILSSHINLCLSFGFSSTKDDSQDSWIGFDAVESEGVRRDAAKKLLDELYDPLFGLINVYFAAQEKHLDHALEPCIEVWIKLGSLLVQCGLKTWDDYFNAYQKSWFAMIETETKKTYSVIYVKNIMNIDPGVYDTHKTQILQVWAQSLVERDSLLKFQHELTAVLFNHDLANGLFSNMPFEVDQELEQYKISLKDFKERRLSLIGTLLENMQREMVRVTDGGDQRNTLVVKSEYVAILQELMNAMKKRYTEIHAYQTAANKATVDASALKRQMIERVDNNYVGFCQQVVEFLQQYTTDICAIDKFFVDSVIFPLPKNDPTYVTSKLKGYFLRLKAERKGWFIQFLQFWQNTVGRVAVERQQGYFVDQILGAFDVGERWMVEVGGGGRTLREFSVIAIFGTYVRRCMEGVGNLVVAVPILGVLEKVVEGLVEEFDSLEEGREVDRRILGILVAILEAVGIAVEEAVGRRGDKLDDPLALHALGMLVEVVRGCDHMVNLLHLRAHHVSEELALDLLRIAVRGLSRLKACLKEEGGWGLPEKLDLIMFEADLPFQEERRRADREYEMEMRKWRVEGGDLYVTRAAGKKKVEWNHLVPQIGIAENRAGLMERIERLMRAVGRGVCEGVVKEAGGYVVERGPMCKWMGELSGIMEREGDSGIIETGFFDMDD